MEIIFKAHYMDFSVNSHALMFLDLLSKSRPELVEPYIPQPLLNHKLMMESMSSYHMYIVTRVAVVSKVS